MLISGDLKSGGLLSLLQYPPNIINQSPPVAPPPHPDKHKLTQFLYLLYGCGSSGLLMQSDLCTSGVQITKIHFYVCNDVIIFVSDETCAKMP